MYTFRPLKIKALFMCPINSRIMLFVGYYLLKLRILKPHFSSMPYYKLSIIIMKCAICFVIYVDLIICIQHLFCRWANLKSWITKSKYKGTLDKIMESINEFIDRLVFHIWKGSLKVLFCTTCCLLTDSESNKTYITYYCIMFENVKI
jgi:hypothetical protein